MIHFCSGLPRSGSTLLLNILGQRDDCHVTPTNDLIELVVGVRNSWMHQQSFISQGLTTVRPKVAKAIRGMMAGFHGEALAGGKTVIDKSRGWPAYIELLEEVFERPIKMLVPVRDLRAIVASFEKLYRSHPLTRHEVFGEQYLQAQTIQGRVDQLLSPNGVVGITIARITDALQRGLSDRMILVPYRQLTENTSVMICGIEDGLGLPNQEYDFTNIRQVTNEDDTVHGLSLHTIRSTIEAPTELPWLNILPNDLAAQIDESFPLMQQLSNVIY